MAAVYFTQAQIKEIQQRLAAIGSKDSKLPVYTKPLTGDEIFAIVQNRENRQIPLKDVMRMIIDHSVMMNTKEYWETHGDTVPEFGQIVIYTDYYIYEEGGEEVVVPAMKIGDGTVPVSDLPFVSNNSLEQILNHIKNVSIHVSNEDREWWERHMDATYIVENERMKLYYTDRNGLIINN